MGGGRLLDVTYPENMNFPKHDHAQAYLCVTVAGGFEQSYAGRDEIHAAGDLAYYEAGEAHRGTYSPAGARVFHVELPDDAVDVRPERMRARHGPSSGALAFGAQIRHLLTRSAAQDPLELEGLATEFVLAYLGKPPARLGSAWLDRAKEYLRESLDSSLSLGGVATELDLHPSHVAREFRRQTGTTVGTWVRRLRCAEAARLLSETDERLVVIASRCGFADQSHMGRTFRSLLGTTPREYRLAARGAIRLTAP